MDITLEACKDTYVVTCNPVNPPAFLPDCEDGWEIGNGTAVCTTQQTTTTLPATGGDLPTGLAAGGAVLVLVGLYALCLVHLRKKRKARAERDKAEWIRRLDEEARQHK